MNLSGIGINKTFKTGTEPVQPYYYVSGTLDLTDAVYGGTYFFNFDNDLSYAHSRDYYNFITADENSVISEVLVYTEPGFELTDNQRSTYFAIGGADYKAVDNSVKVWWAAPPGFGPYNWVNVSITNGARNGSNVCTITTDRPHLLVSGQSVTVNCSNSLLNVTNAQVTVTSDNTFTYTNGAQRSISTVARNGSNVATVVTTSPHGWSNGQIVNVNAVNNSFDATGVSITVVNSTTFTYPNTGASVGTVADAGIVIPTLANSLVVGTVVLTGGPFFNGYPLSPVDLDQSPVNYFGHDGGHYPYNTVPTDSPYTTDLTNRYRYLAVTILEELPDYPVLPNLLTSQQESEQKADEEVIVVNEEVKNENNSRSIKRTRKPRERKSSIRQLPVGEKAVLYGRLTVTLKIYPKNH